MHVVPRAPGNGTFKYTRKSNLAVSLNSEIRAEGRTDLAIIRTLERDSTRPENFSFREEIIYERDSRDEATAAITE
jgi:hypothetical protein